MNEICPECGGPRLYNFVFRHNPVTCSVREREDATQAADEERLDGAREFERPSTDAEILLAETLSGGPLTGDPVTVVRRIVSGIRRRVVAGIDPDTGEVAR